MTNVETCPGCGLARLGGDRRGLRTATMRSWLCRWLAVGF